MITLTFPSGKKINIHLTSKAHFLHFLSLFTRAIEAGAYDQEFNG